MLIRRIEAMMRACTETRAFFPATHVYNEGWMLRLVLDWLATHRHGWLPLVFDQDTHWFSEALLPSRFLLRSRGDSLAESHSHADGVVGQVAIGNSGKCDVSLRRDARQFIVFEAKMFSRLSAGTTNAFYYDQAARTVACMAEVLSRAGRRPDQVQWLGFFLLAPTAQINQGVFSREMTSESVTRKVYERVCAFQGLHDEWFRDWFEPVMERIQIECLSWEDTVRNIARSDSAFGAELERFYKACLRYNGSVA